MAVLGAQLALSPQRKATLEDAGQKPAQGAITLDNVLKLIPGDAVSLFVTGAGLARVVDIDHWVLICFWTCVGVCALLRIAASKPVGAPPLSLKGVNWSLLIVTLIAFFVWAHAVSDTGPVIAAFHGPAAGFAAMVLGVVAPLFVKAS